jgi:XTP/dITP diphosphohydrolase
MLEPLGLALKPQGDWGVPEAVEDAPTFVENALIKARQAARFTGLPAIADDSGLVVPSLGGEPGIYSARYAGENGGAQANMEKLLGRLQGSAGAARNAYFYCALVLVGSADDPAPLVATGRWHGRILEQPRGSGGFGYDPLFGVSGAPAGGGPCSAAELAAEQKAAVSHRGRALRELVRQLRDRDEHLTG